MAKGQICQIIWTNKKSIVTLNVLKRRFRHLLIGRMRISFVITVYQIHVPTHSLQIVCLNVRISAYSYG